MSRGEIGISCLLGGDFCVWGEVLYPFFEISKREVGFGVGDSLGILGFLR